MSDNQSSDINAMVAFGGVVTVRHVPTRQCSQIIIEIPEEFHTAATSMLFGKDAFVLAASGKSMHPYGVLPLSEMSKTESPAAQDTLAEGVTVNEPRRGTEYRMGSGLKVSVDPSKWLGIECQNAAFMFWLNAASAAEAADAVRKVCGVGSRREIAANPQAMSKFMEKIYLPYRRYVQDSASTARGGQQARR